jgi:hypothetical protein
MYDDLKIKEEEVVVAPFMEISRKSPGRTEENNKKFQSL